MLEKMSRKRKLRSTEIGGSDGAPDVTPDEMDVIDVQTRTRWKFVSPDRIANLLKGSPEWKLVSAMGLAATFGIEYCKPQQDAVCEFSAGFDKATSCCHFRGRILPFTKEVIRDAFLLPSGKFTKTVMRWKNEELESLFYKQRAGGNPFSVTWLEDKYKAWAGPIRAVQELLLGKRKSTQVLGKQMWCFYKHISGTVEPEYKPDWAELILDNLGNEVLNLKAHLEKPEAEQRSGSWVKKNYPVNCGTAVMRVLMHFGYSEEELSRRWTGTTAQENRAMKRKSGSQKVKKGSKKDVWKERVAKVVRVSPSSSSENGDPHLEDPAAVEELPENPSHRGVSLQTSQGGKPQALSAVGEETQTSHSGASPMNFSKIDDPQSISKGFDHNETEGDGIALSVVLGALGVHLEGHVKEMGVDNAATTAQEAQEAQGSIATLQDRIKFLEVEVSTLKSEAAASKQKQKESALTLSGYLTLWAVQEEEFREEAEQSRADIEGLRKENADLMIELMDLKEAKRDQIDQYEGHVQAPEEEAELSKTALNTEQIASVDAKRAYEAEAERTRAEADNAKPILEQSDCQNVVLRKLTRDMAEQVDRLGTKRRHRSRESAGAVYEYLAHCKVADV